ncbi:hypothetical protein A2159_01885, partial [Candidatus Woesebacteria bacterium RBG_13_34_9]
MVYSIIQKSQLEGANRLDAEYYQPEYLELAKKIHSLNNHNLKQITIIRSGTTPKDRDDNLLDGVILLKTTDIRNNILSESDNFYHITPKIAQRMLKSKLQSDDVLVNIVGATLDVIGRVSLVPYNFPESNITQAMALLRIKDSNYLPEFIFSYLMSRYGQFQTDRLARPTGQFNLNLEELGQIFIPKISLIQQKNIVEKIKKNIEFQEKSRESYKQAENLLLEELELKNFEIPDDLSYIINFSDIKNAKRMDADYFQLKYDVLISHFKNISKPLINIASRKTEVAKIDPGKEYKYIEISDIDIGSGEIIPNLLLGKNLPANAKMKIDGGEVIISKVRPTRGAIAVIPNEWKENFILSGAFSVFECGYPLREYL